MVGKVSGNKSDTWLQRSKRRIRRQVSAGIVDPAKVVRVALQDAASIAGLLITTDAMIAEAPKKDSAGGRYAWRPRWYGRHGLLVKAPRHVHE